MQFLKGTMDNLWQFQHSANHQPSNCQQPIKPISSLSSWFEGFAVDLRDCPCWATLALGAWSLASHASPSQKQVVIRCDEWWKRQRIAEASRGSTGTFWQIWHQFDIHWQCFSEASCKLLPCILARFFKDRIKSMTSSWWRPLSTQSPLNLTCSWAEVLDASWCTNPQATFGEQVRSQGARMTSAHRHRPALCILFTMTKDARWYKWIQMDSRLLKLFVNFVHFVLILIIIRPPRESICPYFFCRSRKWKSCSWQTKTHQTYRTKANFKPPNSKTRQLSFNGPNYIMWSMTSFGSAWQSACRRNERAAEGLGAVRECLLLLPTCRTNQDEKMLELYKPGRTSLEVQGKGISSL